MGLLSTCKAVALAALTLLCTQLPAHQAASAQGLLEAGQYLTPAEAALAQQLGVHPKVLIAASQLANRRPHEVVRLLQTNPSATLTSSGAVVFGCSLDPGEHTDHQGLHGADTHTQHPPAPQQQQQLEAVLRPAPAHGQQVWDETDTSRAFQLHSRPSATKKILLEFKGCVTEGTEGWNKYYGVDRIVTPAYDSDSHPDAFSEAERQEIITIHAGIAEAFAPWDVDVTTEDPGFEGIERSDEQDEHYGIRMCVGGDSLWTNSSIGGIATLNSFGWINSNGSAVYRDSFVFPSMLTAADGSVHLGYVWKSIVHEIGHTLGLVHKGYVTPDGVREYYTIPPHDSTWAPVMGVPGRGLFVQWSNGQYPAGIKSSNFDDELAIIQKTLPLISDQPATAPNNMLTLCLQTNCTNSSRDAGWLETTLLGQISHPEQQVLYNLTVGMTDPFSMQLTVHGNWNQTYLAQGAWRQVLWRVSNLRPEVVFNSPDVKVEAGAVDPRAWQQNFTVTVLQPDTYMFAVRPSPLLNSSGLAMHTTYGNLGSYQLTVTWPSNATGSNRTAHQV